MCDRWALGLSVTSQALKCILGEQELVSRLRHQPEGVLVFSLLGQVTSASRVTGQAVSDAPV